MLHHQPGYAKGKLEQARRQGYTLEDMIKGVWLSGGPHNIEPRFTSQYYDDSKFKDIVIFVKESIRETLKAIGVKVPRNLDALIKKGYKLVKKLDELLKSDHELEGFTKKPFTR